MRRERMHMRKRRPEFWLRIIFLTWTDATERSHGLPGIVTVSPGRDRGAQHEGYRSRRAKLRLLVRHGWRKSRGKSEQRAHFADCSKSIWMQRHERVETLTRPRRGKGTVDSASGGQEASCTATLTLHPVKTPTQILR